MTRTVDFASLGNSHATSGIQVLGDARQSTGPVRAPLSRRLTGLTELLARIFHTVSSRGAAKGRLARRPKPFRTGLYGDILSGEECEANAARRACSQPQQKECEISGLEIPRRPTTRRDPRANGSRHRECCNDSGLSRPANEVGPMAHTGFGRSLRSSRVASPRSITLAATARVNSDRIPVRRNTGRSEFGAVVVALPATKAGRRCAATSAPCGYLPGSMGGFRTFATASWRLRTCSFR